MPHLAYRIIRCIKTAVFPYKCLRCRSFFNFDQRHPVSNGCAGAAGEDFSIGTLFEHLTAPVLCPDCRKAFFPVTPPVCTVCGRVFKSREGEDHVCGACLDTPGYFTRARAVGIYDQSLMILVHCLKYRGKLQLVRPLSCLLQEAFRRYWPAGYFDMIIPVPLHPKKMRSRGFNQVHLLIGQWPVESFRKSEKTADIHVAADVLVRQQWTRPQTGLGRKDRISNIKNAFYLPDASIVKGRRILLVDDVFTTGSTVNECARVLMKGGAECVHVLTLARGT